METGAVADLTKVTIKGGGATGTGLYVMGTATMNGGTISNVSEGVYATGMGKLTINGGAKITFTRDYGVKVQNGVMASLDRVTITGGGSGQGKGVGV
ncbi:hypothetical protein, partial [Bartonella bovis]|uniref:hypothetical protein n=1 Tax=Bartonella bovis TaxID=155194 RepID=UPI0011AED17E